MPAFHNPSADSEAGWNSFLLEFPEAEVVWGPSVGNPSLLWGFDPIESNGDYANTMISFIQDHPLLFGLLKDEGAVSAMPAALVEPRVIYHCDLNTMEPLPGLREDEWIEPNCAEGTIVRLSQKIGDLPFFNGSILGFFDTVGRMTKLAGEYLGMVDLPRLPLIEYDVAKTTVLEYLGGDEETIAIGQAKLGYLSNLGELLPVWAIRAHLQSPIVELGDDVTLIVDAQENMVIDIFSNIDNDWNEQWAVGGSLDTEAAIQCNEPASRGRWVEDAYSSNGAYGAFNPDLHAYDFEELIGCTVGVRRSNADAFLAPYGWIEVFNYQIDHITSGVCYNSANQAIDCNAISTWTAFNHLLYDLNYFRNSLGFDEDAGGMYEPDHNLIVIVHKNSNDISFCGEGHSSCFREYGFPRVDDENREWNCSQGNPYGYSPYYLIDKNNWNESEPYFPTIVLGSAPNEYDNTNYNGIARHPAHYHEFTHYVQKSFDVAFWGGGSSFDSNETPVFKEGFAMYFGASMEDANVHNFDLTNITCESDQQLFQYTGIFNCCRNVYARGKILSQIFWDIRNGYSAVKGLGKLYADQLAFLAIMESVSTDTRTMTDLYSLVRSISLNEMSAGCPLGSANDCASRIQTVFTRHGVCTTTPCIYTVPDCPNCAGNCPGCSGVVCPNGAVQPTGDNCTGTTTANCSRTTSIHCCGSDPNYPNACDYKESTLAACGLFDDADDCINTCQQELWTYEFRECIRNMNASCKCCYYACYNNPDILDCGLYASKLGCYANCLASWNYERFRCLLNDLRYPEACDVCS